MVFDMYSLSVATAMLIAPIALIIAELALWDYIKTRIQGALLLSASFFLLAIHFIFLTAGYLNLKINFDWAIIITIDIVAFVLLFLFCIGEIRKRKVELGRSMKFIIVLGFALPLSFLVYRYTSLPSEIYRNFGHIIFAEYLLIYLSVSLMVATATLMLSLNRLKIGDIQLIMIGFLLILLGPAVSAVSIELGAWFSIRGVIAWTSLITLIAELLGFILILVAILHLNLAGRYMYSKQKNNPDLVDAK